MDLMELLQYITDTTLGVGMLIVWWLTYRRVDQRLAELTYRIALLTGQERDHYDPERSKLSVEHRSRKREH